MITALTSGLTLAKLVVYFPHFNFKKYLVPDKTPNRAEGSLT